MPSPSGSVASMVTTSGPDWAIVSGARPAKPHSATISMSACSATSWRRPYLVSVWPSTMARRIVIANPQALHYGASAEPLVLARQPGRDSPGMLLTWHHELDVVPLWLVGIAFALLSFFDERMLARSLAAGEDREKRPGEHVGPEADHGAPGDPPAGKQDEPDGSSRHEAEARPGEQRSPAKPAEQQADQPGQLDIPAAQLAGAQQAEHQVRGAERQSANQRPGESRPVVIR